MAITSWVNGHRWTALFATAVLVVAAIGIVVPEAAMILFQLELVVAWPLAPLVGSGGSKKAAIAAITMYALVIFGIRFPEMSAAFFGGIIAMDMFAIALAVRQYARENHEEIRKGSGVRT